MLESVHKEESDSTTDDDYDEEFDFGDGRQEIIATDVNEGFDAQEVIPRLFLGSVYAATDAEVMRSRGITHVLVVSGILPKLFPDDFTYCQVDIDDFEVENLLQVLPSCIPFISSCLADPQCSILVHCQGGVSRSVSVVTAFLMHRKGIAFEPALDMVRQVRMVYPNEGFREQLKDLYTYILSSGEVQNWEDPQGYFESSGYKICMERKEARDKEYREDSKKTPLFEVFKELAKSGHS